MAFKLGVLFIHGMGNQDAGYADGMIEELRPRLRRLGSDDREICFEAAWWAPVLATKEDALIRSLAAGNQLEWMPLRRFIIHSLADAIAYQDTYRPTSADQINVYRHVHQVIRERVRELRGRLMAEREPSGPEPPLVIVAHSLGCHMISNYIWDARSGGAGRRATPFERFETLSAIVTLGCNIPIFTLAFTNLEPIDFPTPGLEACFPGAAPAEVDAIAQWINLYDPDDVLGYPLRGLDPKYAATVSEDVAVNVGGWLRSWNPASHTAYWTDNDVTTRVADLLHRTLALL